MQLFKHFSYFIIIYMAICKISSHDAEKDDFNFKIVTPHSFMRIFAGRKIFIYYSSQYKRTSIQECLSLEFEFVPWNGLMANILYIRVCKVKWIYLLG